MHKPTTHVVPDSVRFVGTSEPCPPWCALPPGHPYEVGLAGLAVDFRAHERECSADVLISQVEERRDGVMQRDEPVVTVLAEELDAWRALEVASSLQQAVDWMLR